MSNFISVDQFNNKAQKFEDVDQFELDMEHWSDMQTELKMDSVWSIYDGGRMSSDTMLFKDRQYLVRYRYVRSDATIEELNADLTDGKNRTMAEVTMVAASGSIGDLWSAANSCIKQSGTHHSYIEDFQVQDDGTLVLITGS
jgi:hypothetical protein